MDGNSTFRSLSQRTETDRWEKNSIKISTFHRGGGRGGGGEDADGNLMNLKLFDINLKIYGAFCDKGRK